jgi:hypothetical protein
MISRAAPSAEILEICRRWSLEVAALAGSNERIAFFRRGLPDLLLKRMLFADILKGLLNGSGYPDLRLGTLFDNELVLFQDPGRIFSLRMYIFGPGEHTPVHDHTSWGVSGSALARLEVVRYRRMDEGSRPDQMQLALDARCVLSPGETELTLPFDQGIHRTGNPFDGTTLMVSIYGPPGRRLFIRRFNLESGRVQRVFPQRIKKRMLAEQALKDMDGH